VPCIDNDNGRYRLAPLPLVALVCAGLVLSACGNRERAVDQRPSDQVLVTPAEPPVTPRPWAVDGTRAPGAVRLAAPTTPRNVKELQLQFARRLVAAHPETSYTDRTPDRLSAIPVLEVELHGDGSVRRIKVLRTPSTGDEATALAIAAVRRAAPFGNVSKLPKPWMVVETFLFDDQLRFKPRTLDID
jgi:hypothetical protein